MTRPLRLRPEEIQEQVQQLGEELSAAYADGVVLVGVLDHAERYRDVPSLTGVDPIELAAHPGRLVPHLFGRG